MLLFSRDAIGSESTYDRYPQGFYIKLTIVYLMRDGKPRIILLVEDDLAIVELLNLYFKPLNIELYRAHGGMEGVQLYRRLLSNGKRPDLVIMDIKLPAMNGIEATILFSRLKQAGCQGRVPPGFFHAGGVFGQR